MLSVNVLTWHNDNTRQGQNINEATLTPSNVSYTSFGQMFSYAVTGQVYAQPLYVSNLTIPGKGALNVVFVATQNNDVYAFNANTNSGVGQGLLWHVNLGLAAATPNSFFANRYGPYHDINPQVGITSTPVIDLASGTMYVDAFTNDVAGQNVYSHHIHALNITTGADKVTPMLVAASVAGNGVGGNGTTVTFSAEQQLQRPALTLLNGVLYVAYGSFADTDPYHGWVLGFDATSLHLLSVLNTSPNSLGGSSNPGEAGFWNCGAGLASDGTNLFMITGNGDYNPAVGDYGDSFLKVAPDNSSQASPNATGYALAVKDYFSPYNQLALANADADLGSGGGLLLPDQSGPNPHEMIGAGKQGTVYLVNRDNLGQHTSSVDNVIQEVSLGHGVFGSPAYFNGSIYYHAAGDVLKRYSLTNGMLSAAPAATSTLAATSGGTPSVSSNGTANGIVWDVQWDASHQVLHAYDATTLAEVYNSNQNTTRDQMDVGVKFITPTIADGEVFVGSADKLYIYGEMAPVTTAPAAPSNAGAIAVSASTVNVTWVDNSNNENAFLIERSTDNVNFAQIGTSGVNTTSYPDTTVSANTQYYYRIRATNAIGTSAYTVPSASATTPAATGATDVYHFDEGSGTTTADSGSANNATLTGAPLPTWVTPGKTGTAALSFSGDGTYNQTALQSAVHVSSDLAPVLGSTSSLDAWIKTTQVGSATHWKAPAITGVEATGSANDINWGSLDANGHIGIYVGDNGGLFSNSPVNNGQWHNIAITRNATTGVVQVYVDGVLNGSGTFDTGNKTSSFFLIGALSDVGGDGVTRTGDNYFNGQLDEVRIYNQVLTQNDVNSLSMVPAAPQLQTITAATGPVIHLTFSNPSAYASSIEVDRKTGANGTYAAIATLPPTATVYDDSNVTAGVTYYYVLKSFDVAGASPLSNALNITPPLPSIVGNYLFYNQSKYDSFNGSSNLTDDNAVATDKVALLDGQTASYQNYSDYSKGINGIMVDIANLVYLPRLDDFQFMVGNNDFPSTWTQAPTPTLINTYPGRGPGGSTQITVIWDDNAIQNEWLQVTVLAQPHLNLPANDVFYFGNAIGSTGVSASSAQVTAADVNAISTNQTTAAGISNPFDLNRDGVVDSTDVSIASANQSTAANALRLISLGNPQITGTSGNDTIRLVRSGANLAVYINSAATATYTLPYASISGLVVDGGTGTDTINVDFSGGSSPVPSGGLTVTGVNGRDTLIVTGTSGNDAVTINSNVVSLNGSAIQFTSLQSIIIDGNGGSDSLTQTANPGNSATLVFNGGTTGGPSSTDALNVSSGTFTFSAVGPGSGVSPLSLASLYVGAGASVVLSNAPAHADRYLLSIGSLALAGFAGNWTGSLDLGWNDAVVHAGAIGILNSQVAQGFNALGGGIISSAAVNNTTHLTALGVIQNTADGTTSGAALYGSGAPLGTFDSANVIKSDILIKYTFLGDANLDGKVDASDYSRIDTGFLSNATGWFNGDFNYDSAGNGSDYTLIDNAFNVQGASLAAVIAAPAAAISLPPVAAVNEARRPRSDRSTVITSLTSVSSNTFQTSIPISSTAQNNDTLPSEKRVHNKTFWSWLDAEKP